MTPENDFILSKDGLLLHLHHWKHENPSHVICIIHGLGEHGGRYTPMAEYLLKYNMATVCLDLRGHGKSEGKKGHTPNYEYLLSDIEELLKYVRLSYIDSSLILFGHSMGGNIVANFVLEKTTSEVARVILSAPFFEVAFDPPAWKTKLAKALGNILPALTQSNELSTQYLSRIKDEVEKYEKDPLVHDRISVGLYLSLIEKGQSALLTEKTINIPGLLFHGTDDQLVSYAASERFRETHQNFEWHSLEGVFHEPHNDLGKEKVLELIKDFILRV